jgi:hypothetical protein
MAERIKQEAKAEEVLQFNQDLDAIVQTRAEQVTDEELLAAWSEVNLQEAST